jgi:hypothetical protein
VLEAIPRQPIESSPEELREDHSTPSIVSKGEIRMMNTRKIEDHPSGGLLAEASVHVHTAHVFDKKRILLPNRAVKPVLVSLPSAGIVKVIVSAIRTRKDRLDPRRQFFKKSRILFKKFRTFGRGRSHRAAEEQEHG